MSIVEATPWNFEEYQEHPVANPWEFDSVDINPINESVPTPEVFDDNLIDAILADNAKVTALLPPTPVELIGAVVDDKINQAINIAKEDVSKLILTGAITLSTLGAVEAVQNHNARPSIQTHTIEHVVKANSESVLTVAHDLGTSPEIVIAQNKDILPSANEADPTAPLSPGTDLKVTIATPELPSTSNTVVAAAPETTQTTVEAAPPNNKLLFDGDSLTDGMKNAGLQNLVTSNGWEVNDIQATVGDSVAKAIPKLEADSSQLQEAGTIVVGLGTNNCMLYTSTPSCESVPEFETQIQAEITAIRAKNPSAKIFWTNMYTTKGLQYEAINQAIANLAGTLNYQVIDWAAEVQANPSKYSFDTALGVHQTTTQGYANMAAFVASQVGKAPEATPAPAASTTTIPVPAPAPAIAPVSPSAPAIDPNSPQNIHDELKAFGFSESGTDGIMGNIKAESGQATNGDLQPNRLENTASGVVTAYANIPSYDINNSKMGYGFVQWTPIGPKLGNFALAYHMDPNYEGTQIMYLETELKTMPILMGDLKNPSISPQEEARLFEAQFERPASLSDAPVREAFGQNFYVQFNKPAPTPVPAPTTTTTPTTAPVVSPSSTTTLPIHTIKPTNKTTPTNIVTQTTKPSSIDTPSNTMPTTSTTLPTSTHRAKATGIAR